MIESNIHEIAPLKTALTFHVDNVSAIKLTKNPTFYKRTKYIDMRFYYVREQIQEG